MKKAYFCIDGFSFKRISDFYRYEHRVHSRLNIAAIETYLRFEITRRLDWNCSTEALDIEKHFYHPGESPQIAFEKKLIECGYNVHYSGRANILDPKPNNNIFTDWIIARALRKYDIFILLTTQGQYANIFKQAKRCNIQSLLIGWDSPCKNSTGRDSRWKTDKKLIGYASIYCPMEKMLNQSESVFADVMFEKFCPSYPSNLLYG
ncbi:MAG: hypothetical protein LBC75_12340 [Fibromonadaceae bacterium]|jgi:hypothetical protein|nr:hypothetical protein [Fibromonadaceae bacterium]